MNLNKIYDFNNIGGISDIFSFSGSCGIYEGYQCVTKETQNGFVSQNKDFTLKSEVECIDNVFMRSDFIKNTSADDIDIYKYAYRFCFEGEEMDIYTQYSCWQNESYGDWQKLVTEISVSSKNLHTTSDGTPMVAVWNRQTSRGVVFHLLPQFAWKISVSKRNDIVSKNVFTVIEIALNDDALRLPLKKGEILDFSSVIYYEFTDKLSLDCHKLHNFLNKKYPRRELPVMYNTWLAFFDRVDYDKIYKQIKEAADIGCEYFTLDAGWFGDGEYSWEDQIGCWVENKTNAYKGRMKEVSDEIYKAGMKFGLWLEPERALEKTQIVKEHPEYFFKNNKSYFLDFANDEAREYITKLTLDLIEKYNISYLKFDFNDSITFDQNQKAFYDYHKGNLKYIKSIKEQYPEIYLECCAGGGFRMDIQKLTEYDSFWFSDNQSPYYSVEIMKNTVLRMLPSAIDRWAVLTSQDGFIPDYHNKKTVRTIATDNGTWDEVIGVKPEYICGFFAGGAPALSCDLTNMDENLKKHLKEFIDNFKKERNFWKNASCRILTDIQSVLVMQYENNDEIKIVVYTNKVKQAALTLYPVTQKRDYNVDGIQRTYEDIQTNGIRIEEPQNKYSYIISLK